MAGGTRTVGVVRATGQGWLADPAASAAVVSVLVLWGRATLK
jgi:hypothetical protein